MISKKRVFIDGEVLTLPHFSGIGHYTLALLKALDANLEQHPELDVRIFVYFKYARMARSFGFTHIKTVRSPIHPKISNGLKRLGIQPPLDLLFGKGLYIFPNFTSWPLLFSESIPFIYDLSFVKYPELSEPRNQKFLLRQTRKAADRALRVATISNYTKREINEFYNLPLEKIDVLYPAVDTNIFHERPDSEVQAAKVNYGIVGKYLLFIGNIEPRKNLQNLLLAYELLDKKLREEYALLLVGAGGWQNEEILATIERLRSAGNHILQPNKYVRDEDLPTLYSGASLFVYPSLYEGFGIPPLEAIACGVPTITGSGSSLPEAVGDAALTVDALSIEDISKAIYTVLTDKTVQQRLQQNGHTQVEKFSWDTSAQNLLQIVSGSYPNTKD